MNNSGPLVSIITVCLNSERHIAQAIESVLNQTYHNIEYIIIDGGSTDRTIEIVKNYQHRFKGRMKWLSEKDKGLYDAMNKGIGRAQGEIVGMINSDDWYEEDAVEQIVRQYQNDSGIDVFYGDLYWVDGEGKRTLSKPFKHIEQYTFYYWMPFTHPTMFVKKSTYERMGLYDLNYSIASDYEFIMRCLHQHCIFHYIDAPIANFRDGGISSNPLKGFKQSTKIKVKYGCNFLYAWWRYFEVSLKVRIKALVTKR